MLRSLRSGCDSTLLTVTSRRLEFCTLFDSAYLPRGLVLYRSLARVCDDFTLRVFCMDEYTHSILERLALPGLEPIALSELEGYDAALLGTKAGRTRAEYCWTATPSACLFCLDRYPDIDEITYLDADLMFFEDPRVLFAEMGTAAILITPHRYSHEYLADDFFEGTSADSGGIYNVQFLTFRRRGDGERALRWWHERCIEWCYARYEPGRFGDQKYLDDWPDRFAGVHVLEHPGGGLAPWNASQYRIWRDGDRAMVGEQPVVFHHYQGLRLYSGPSAVRRAGLLASGFHLQREPLPLVWWAGWILSPAELEILWEPYMRRLGEAILEIRRMDPDFAAGFVPLRAGALAYEAARAVVPARGRRALRRVLKRAGRRSDLAAGTSIPGR
jgi:hypothetical protein